MWQKRTAASVLLALLALNWQEPFAAAGLRSDDPETSNEALAAMGQGKCRHDEIPSCENQTRTPPPPGNLDAVSAIRRGIVAQAASQIGHVSYLRSRDCNKRGWRDLIDYHERAYGRVLSANERRVLKRPMLDKDSQVKLVDWCGIFALWAVKTAASAADASLAACGPPPLSSPGKPSDYRNGYLPFTRWVTNREGGGGGGIEGLVYKSGSTGLAPGDIVVIQGELNHHAVVERVANGRVYTIDGNVECGMVVRKSRPIAEVAGFYATD